MLTALSVRNVVLIDSLDLTFASGLSVLTGETGAGKSILLDALGLALGARADAGLVRPGAEQATVTATFDIPDGHPVRAALKESGVEDEDVLILRRVTGADGRSRAFANDQPISVGLLRQVGESLVEVHGQFDERGLMDRRVHRAALDAYGDLGRLSGKTGDAWRRWRAARAAWEDAKATAQAAGEEERALRDAVDELLQLAPRTGEENELAERRTMLMHAEQIADAMTGALSELGGDGDAAGRLRAAQRQLEKVSSKAGGRLDAALAALDRARVEVEEALHELQTAAADLDGEGSGLQEVEDRLFAMRDVARKHGVFVDDLPDLLIRMTERLALIEDSGGTLQRLQAEAKAGGSAYVAAAEALSRARQEAAKRLDRTVTAELPPLRLDKARFTTVIEPLDEADWGENGVDRIEFMVATNPGSAPGPLGKIASGGELSRFMLALKLALVEVGTANTLVFDEVDAGIGGATADAVGERLERLGVRQQVLVVTHSPQVAARGVDHLRVEKQVGKTSASTIVERLDAAGRREEVARMLSGQTVTDEARGAAERLIRRELA